MNDDPVPWLVDLDYKLWRRKRLGKKPYCHYVRDVPLLHTTSIAEVDRVLEIAQSDDFVWQLLMGETLCLHLRTVTSMELMLVLAPQHFETLQQASKAEHLQFFKQLALAESNTSKLHKSWSAYIK